MTELETFIASKSTNLPATIRNYRAQYKNIRELLDNDIIHSTEVKILNVVKSRANGNPSTEWTYLNLPFMIRELYKKPVDVIQKRRNELKELVKQHTKANKIITNEKLPDYKEVENYVKELYKNKDYKKYIVNYLILTYGVRNKDINCYIIHSKDDMTKDDINYLIVKPSSVEWIINDYKTLKSYGQKRIIIKSKPFLEAINTFTPNRWLLNGSMTQLNDTSVGTTIMRMLYNKLTEGDYFKIIMNNINSKPNTTELLEYYSKTRGTSYEMLITYYDTKKREGVNEDTDKSV